MPKFRKKPVVIEARQVPTSQPAVKPIEVMAYEHLEAVTRQRDIFRDAAQFVAEGECSSIDSKAGCDPTSEDGLCEVCTCRQAIQTAQLFGELDR